MSLKDRYYGNSFIYHNIIISIVMEYADNGDLFEKIKDMQIREVMFSEDQIWKLFM